jgi:hypothetical protein
MERFGFANKDEVVGWEFDDILQTPDTREFNEEHGFTARFQAEQDRLQEIASRTDGHREWIKVANDNGCLVGKGSCVHVKNRHNVVYCKRFELLQHAAVPDSFPIVNRMSILPWVTKGEPDGYTYNTGWIIEFFDKEHTSPTMQQALKHFKSNPKDVRYWITSLGVVEDCTESWLDRWGFKDKSEVVGMNIHHLMNNRVTEDFNKTFGFFKRYKDHMDHLQRESIREFGGTGKVKVHIDSIQQLQDAPRYDLLQVPNRTKALRKQTAPSVARLSMKPYVTGSDGRIVQFVCELFPDESISKRMEHALIVSAVDLA